MTRPLIIEELSPEAPLTGAFFDFPPSHPEPHPMDLVFAPSQIEAWPIARLRPYARNAKMHGDDQVAKIAAMAEDFDLTLVWMLRGMQGHRECCLAAKPLSRHWPSRLG